VPNETPLSVNKHFFKKYCAVFWRRKRGSGSEKKWLVKDEQSWMKLYMRNSRQIRHVSSRQARTYTGLGVQQCPGNGENTNPAGKDQQGDIATLVSRLP
jgi:hypothetical protein